MKAIFLYTAALAFQMNTLQERPVVHPAPERTSISNDFGGKMLELVNAPGRDIAAQEPA